MTTFDERERAFEAKFAHDEEMQFKAVARRNKLAGLWAAERMGMSPAEADAYAGEVIKADFEEAGDGDVIRKIRGDLEARGIAIDDQEIIAKLAECLIEAKAQLA